MDGLDALLKNLQQQAIRDASRISPEFAAKVEEERREIAEHEQKLEDQRLAKKEEPAEAAQRKTLWGKMIESKSTES